MRIGAKLIHNAAQKYLKGKLLDIGCGSKYKHLLIGDFVTEYIGLDHEHSPHNLEKVDIMGTAYDIPEKSDSFDSILCTAVLEHLEEPEQALCEAYRVLKSGGYAVYTIPLFWHLHEEPRDFYRFTKHGIRYLFEKTGFELVEIKASSGFWVTFGSEFNYYINRFKRGPLKLIIPLIIILNNLICLTLEKIDKPEEFTWMYLVVVKKI